MTSSPTEHRLPATPHTVHTGFWDNSLEPVLTIGSGDIVALETMTLLDGRLRPEIGLQELLTLRGSYRARGLTSHTLTGPIYVEGAEPGDALEVRILDLVPQPYGVGYFLPGEMGAGTLPEEFPEGRLFGFRWSEGDSSVSFGHGIRLPLRPFMGMMGVAPAAPGRLTASSPGPHGSNMDLKELGPGSTLFLPVFVRGALFSAGDAHAMQGDGEVSGTALETATKEARLKFIVRKDQRCPES